MLDDCKEGELGNSGNNDVPDESQTTEIKRRLDAMVSFANGLAKNPQAGPLYPLAMKDREKRIKAVYSRRRQEKWPVNETIKQFFFDNMELTQMDSDIVPVDIAYRIYLAYTDEPVDEAEFSAYIVDMYPRVNVTVRMVGGLYQPIIEKCRFITVERAIECDRKAEEKKPKLIH